MASISVVIMTFNEAASLESVVREITSELESIKASYEILIIDDGSSDGSGEIADRLARQIPHTCSIHHDGNQGLGAVYRSGFALAKNDYITFFPADGQFPATIIKEFALAMKDYDMVLGYLPNRNVSWIGKTLSMAERILYRCLFGPMPKFQGILMFRRSLLQEIPLTSSGRGWTVLMELILKTYRKGYRVKSLPTEIRPRLSGGSKVNNLATLWDNLKQVFILRRSL